MDLSFWGSIGDFFEVVWFVITWRDPAPSACPNDDCA